MNFTSIPEAQGSTVEKRGNRYRTAGWIRATIAYSRRSDNELVRLLKKSTYSIQKVYRQLMAAHDGEPLGVECRHKSRQHWAFVVPETGVPGDFRVQYFDEDGFTNHLVYRKMEEAVETMLREGYRVVEPGTLDKVAATARWARGVKVATLRQRCQEGLMTYSDMIDAVKAL